jgi:tRNA U34 5-methylaminomethyl-2-thiouridine-forming methyltransferase MnmC
VSSVKIIETKDGSHSLLNESLNETYHSTHGAVQESIHVFIQKGLNFWIENNESKQLAILEVGFGTGLNALLTLKESIEQKIKIHYTSLEAFPVESSLVRQLNYPSLVPFDSSEEKFYTLHQCEWNTEVAITPDFALEKLEAKLQEIDLGTKKYDLVYFDAFAPAKQPEMWDISVLDKVARSLKGNGVFVTYCAQGQLKRNLKSLQLQVESLPGPPGKREMVRAIKQAEEN